MYDPQKPPSACDLASKSHEFAEKNLSETTKVRSESVEEITRWLSEHPEINAHDDPKYVVYFLRGSKYDLEKTKRKILSYYRMRAERDEWFNNRDPFLPELVELLDIGVFLPLKVKDEKNRQVVIIRTAAHNPKVHKQNDVFKICKMILDLLIYMDESISVYGIVALFDMKNVTLGHALQLPPQLIKRTVESWENYPCRPQLLEFVNAPFYVNFILNIFRSFMSSKMKSRVTVSGNRSVISKQVNLPPELGGTSENYQELAVYWKRVAQENAAWFQNDERFKSTVIPT